MKFSWGQAHIATSFIEYDNLMVTIYIFIYIPFKHMYIMMFGQLFTFVEPETVAKVAVESCLCCCSN